MREAGLHVQSDHGLVPTQTRLSKQCRPLLDKNAGQSELAAAQGPRGSCCTAARASAPAPQVLLSVLQFLTRPRTRAVTPPGGQPPTRPRWTPAHQGCRMQDAQGAPHLPQALQPLLRQRGGGAKAVVVTRQGIQRRVRLPVESATRALAGRALGDAETRVRTRTAVRGAGRRRRDQRMNLLQMFETALQGTPLWVARAWAMRMSTRVSASLTAGYTDCSVEPNL